MSDVVTVQPRAVAEYRAIHLTATEDEPAVAALALATGALRVEWAVTRRKGRSVSVLRVTGKNRKTYDLAVGDWLVILGNSGSIRACTDKQFQQDYTKKETAE